MADVLINNLLALSLTQRDPYYFVFDVIGLKSSKKLIHKFVKLYGYSSLDSIDFKLNDDFHWYYSSF